jgi:hypothetical protein
MQLVAVQDEASSTTSTGGSSARRAAPTAAPRPTCIAASQRCSNSSRGETSPLRPRPSWRGAKGRGRSWARAKGEGVTARRRYIAFLVAEKATTAATASLDSAPLKAEGLTETPVSLF